MTFQSPDRQLWLKKEFAVFMNSVSILNQGLLHIKTCQSPDVCHDITTDTYVKLITTLLETVGEDRKADLRDRLATAMIDDSVSEYSVALATKRRRTD